MSQKPLHVIILAAGKGSRMRSSLPKVLHKVAGKSLLGHVLDVSLSLNPQQVHVVVGHGKDQVMAEFANHERAAQLNWVEQSEQLGTGHAVMQALPSIESEASVLMLTADVPLIEHSTLESMVNLMATSRLALLTAMVDNPYGLGRITRDDTNTVIGIVEEKDATEHQRGIREINSGIICADKFSLESWLHQVGSDNAQQEYYLTDVVGIAYAAGNLITTLQPQSNDEIIGINSRVQLAQAECAYQHRQATRLMEQGVTIIDPHRIDIRGEVVVGEDTIIDVNVVIEGPTTIGANVSIAPNCVITASSIGDGATILPNTVIEHAELGDQATVGPFARLRPGTRLAAKVKIGNFVETKNAQLAAGAKVNHLSYVGDATVGARTNIGAGVITCNYDGAYKHQTTIGEDVFVGSDCQLVAPVSIGDNATVGAGSTITNDVGAGQLAISRGKQRHISGWQRPSKNK